MRHFRGRERDGVRERRKQGRERERSSVGGGGAPLIHGRGSEQVERDELGTLPRSLQRAEVEDDPGTCFSFFFSI